VIFQLPICSILLLRRSDDRPIVWCIIGAFAGLYIFYRGFLLLQRRHLILDTPASKVRSASLGMVELNGLATGPYTVVAPITERACYYYRTIAWEWKRQGRNTKWVKVAAECMHVPFFLDDNTGKIMVDPRGAELDLHRDFQQQFCDGFFTLKQEAPPNVHSFLSRHGVSTNNKIKVEEFCIKPKNALFVLGTLDENLSLELSPKPIPEMESVSAGSTFSFSLGGSAVSWMGNAMGASPLLDLASRRKSEDARLGAAVLGNSKLNSSSTTANAATKVIHLSTAAAPANTTEMTQQQKVAAALMRAGITNPTAWAAAGVAPGTPVFGSSAASQENSSPADFEQHPRVVIMKGENNPTFLISWRSQRDLARTLGWKCTLMIWGGPALTILCLYALHSMTHWF
jgi:hypothetical protein